MQGLREGEEVLFEFSPLARNGDVARVFWMSRIGEPSKRTKFWYAHP